MAFHLLEKDREGASELAGGHRGRASKASGRCERCRMFTETELCEICRASDSRNAALLCVVETPADVVAVEDGVRLQRDATSC
jgi:recombination protein RecR